MTEKSIQIRIPADDEGFIALRCPHCAGDFKALAADLEKFEGDYLYCARCGLSHYAARFWPPEVLGVAEQHIENLAADMISDFLGNLERSFRGSKYIKMETSKPKKESVRELRAITDHAAAELPCCETSVKLPFDQAASVFYCPFCGQVQD